MPRLTEGDIGDLLKRFPNINTEQGLLEAEEELLKDEPSLEARAVSRRVLAVAQAQARARETARIQTDFFDDDNVSANLKKQFEITEEGVLNPIGGDMGQAMKTAKRANVLEALRNAKIDPNEAAKLFGGVGFLTEALGIDLKEVPGAQTGANIFGGVLSGFQQVGEGIGTLGTTVGEATGLKGKLGPLGHFLGIENNIHDAAELIFDDAHAAHLRANGLRVEDFSKLTRQALGAESFAFRHAEGITHMVAMMAIAAGGGQLLSGTAVAPGLLTEAASFGLTSAAITESDLKGRAIAGGAGALGVGVAKGVMTRLSAPILGHYGNKLVESFGAKGMGRELAKTTVSRYIPGMANLLVESGIFTAVGFGQSLALNEDFDFLDAYMHNLAYAGAIKTFGVAKQRFKGGQSILDPVTGAEVGKTKGGVRELLTGTARSKALNTQFEARINSLTRGLEEQGGPTKPALRELASTGVDPYELKIAEGLAKRTFKLDAKTAETIAEKPAVAQALLASQKNILLMDSTSFKKWLESNRHLMESGKDFLGVDAEVTAPTRFIDGLETVIKNTDTAKAVEGVALPAKLREMLNLRASYARQAKVAERQLAEGLAEAQASGKSGPKEFHSFQEMHKFLRVERHNVGEGKAEVAAKVLQAAQAAVHRIDGKLAENPMTVGLGGKEPFLNVDFRAVVHSPSEVALRITNLRPTPKGQEAARALRETLGERKQGGATDTEILARFIEGDKAFKGKVAASDKAVKIEKNLLVDTQKYLTSLRSWFENGEQGARPQPTPRMRKAGVDVAEAHSLLAGVARRAKEHLRDAAANVVPDNSEAAARLKSSRPEAAAVIEELNRTSTLIKPTTPFEPPIEPLTGSKAANRNRGRVEEPLGLLEAAKEMGERASKVVETFDMSTTPGARGVDAGGGLGLQFMKPNIFDRSFRQQFLAIQKMFIGKAGIDLSNLTLEGQAKYSTLINNSFKFVGQTMGAYSEYLGSLKKIDARDGSNLTQQAMERLFALREGGVKNAEGLHKSEVEALHALDRLFKSYEQALEAQGFDLSKTKGGTYITRMVKSMGADGLGKFLDSTTQRQFKEVTSKFLRDRTSNAPHEQVVKDVFDILNTYIPSVARVIAYRPVSEAYIKIIESKGVKPEKGQVGKVTEDIGFGYSTKRFEYKEGGIPIESVRYLATHATIMQGTPGRVSKALEAAVDTVYNRAHKIAGTDPKKGFGRDFFRIMGMGFNTLAIGGIPVGGAIRNLVTGGAISWADPALGPKWFLKGQVNVFQKNADGTGYRLNPLLKELGLIDTGFAAKVRTELMGGMKGHLKGVGKNGVEWWLKMFEGSEILVRGASAIGAYHHAKASNFSETQARSFARNVAARTQTNYDAVTGARALSGSAGKFFGQFQRFGFNNMDHFWGLLQRSGFLGETNRMVGEARLPTIEQMAGKGTLTPAERPLANLAMYLVTVYGAGMVSEAFGMDFADFDGPFAAAPEFAKSVAEGGISAGASLVTENEKQRVELTGAITSNLGIKPRSRNMWQSLVDSTGPGVTFTASLSEWLVRGTTMSEKDKDAAFRDMSLVFRGGTTGDRILRFLQENEDDFIRSRATGHRLAPVGRKLTMREKVLRLVGIQPAEIADEFKELGDTRALEKLWKDRMSGLNSAAKDSLADGENPTQVFADYASGINALSRDYGIDLSLKSIKQRWNGIVTETQEREGRTLTERIRDRAPFTDSPR